MSCLQLLLPTLFRRSVRQRIRHYPILPGFPVLVLLTVTLDTRSNEAPPELIIPLGSYLEHFNIGCISYKQGQVYTKRTVFCDYRRMLSFEMMDNIPDPGSCWSQGYDLAKGICTDLSCDTTRQRNPEEVSRFLYSAPMRHGSYLTNCTGIIKTLENNRYYLYASCMKAGHGSSPPDVYYKKNRLDITDCQNDINSDEAGILSCTDAPVSPKQILSGSYLSLCNLSDTYYNPGSEFDYVESVCGLERKRIILRDAGPCIGSGKDIAFPSGSIYSVQDEFSLSKADNCSESDVTYNNYREALQKPNPVVGKDPICSADPTKEVRLYFASQYIPAGSYLLTCRKIAFYPCMGPDRQGVLSAQCLNMDGEFQDTQLAYGESECRMSKPGYISNVRGQLHCDPDSPFDDKDSTQGTDLSSHFQCNEE